MAIEDVALKDILTELFLLLVGHADTHVGNLPSHIYFLNRLGHTDATELSASSKVTSKMFRESIFWKSKKWLSLLRIKIVL